MDQTLTYRSVVYGRSSDQVATAGGSVPPSVPDPTLPTVAAWATAGDWLRAMVAMHISVQNVQIVLHPDRSLALWLRHGCADRWLCVYAEHDGSCAVWRTDGSAQEYVLGARRRYELLAWWGGVVLDRAALVALLVGEGE